MHTTHVELTKLEVELLHRLFSAKILAAPPGVEDELRKKMAAAKRKMREQTSETIDHGRDDNERAGVPEVSLPTDEDGLDRAASLASHEGQDADPHVDEARV